MLNFGELFVVCFITGAILSYPFWLKTGEWLGEHLASRGRADSKPPAED